MNVKTIIGSVLLIVELKRECVMTTLFTPGDIFPDINVQTSQNTAVTLIPAVTPHTPSDLWQMIVVYRGKHCPICANYLNQLEGLREDFSKAKVAITAVSADSVEQLNVFLNEKIPDVNFPVYAGLSIEHMQSLGVYISDPRNEKETDHPFAEPALFVVNPKGQTQFIDVANAPFIRPDLSQVLRGIEFSRENNYPIRGTHF